MVMMVLIMPDSEPPQRQHTVPQVLMVLCSSTLPLFPLNSRTSSAKSCDCFDLNERCVQGRPELLDAP